MKALLERLVIHFLKFGNLSLIKGMVILSTVKVDENAQYKVCEVTTTESRTGQSYILHIRANEQQG